MFLNFIFSIFILVVTNWRYIVLHECTLFFRISWSVLGETGLWVFSDKIQRHSFLTWVEQNFRNHWGAWYCSERVLWKCSDENLLTDEKHKLLLCISLDSLPDLLMLYLFGVTDSGRKQQQWVYAMVSVCVTIYCNRKKEEIAGGEGGGVCDSCQGKMMCIKTTWLL